MTKRNIAKRPLTDLQQAILDIVWRHGTVTAEQIREALQPAHPLKDSSIRTLLRRLEARGVIAHQVDGKVFQYRAVDAPRSVAARAVRQIIDRFCAGSIEQFLVGMVDEKVLSADELQRLARKVRSRK